MNKYKIASLGLFIVIIIIFIIIIKFFSRLSEKKTKYELSLEMNNGRKTFVYTNNKNNHSFKNLIDDSAKIIQYDLTKKLMLSDMQHSINDTFELRYKKKNLDEEITIYLNDTKQITNLKEYIEKKLKDTLTSEEQADLYNTNLYDHFEDFKLLKQPQNNEEPSEILICDYAFLKEDNDLRNKQHKIKDDLIYLKEIKSIQYKTLDKE